MHLIYVYLYDSSPVCRFPQCFQSDVFSVHYILLCQLQHQCVPGYIQFSPFRIAFSFMLHSIFQFENISMYNSKSFSLKIFCVTLIKIHQCKGEKKWYFLTMIFLFKQMVLISIVFCIHTFGNTVLWILFLLLFYSA